MTSSIKVGWAERDITPERPVLLRGLFHLRVSTHVKDRLTATMLVVDNGEDHALMGSIDATGISDDVIARVGAGVKERIPEINPDKLFISATHTHTGPFNEANTGLQREADYLDELKKQFPDYMPIAEYSDFLVSQLIDAACEAWQTRSEGKIGWGFSYAVVGENRRIRYFDDSAKMYGAVNVPEFSHVEGHVDHSVNLLFTYDNEENLTGVLVNLACPSQANEGGQDYISADYWTAVRQELRQRYGADLSILPQCSAAGDLTPHRMIARPAEDRMMRLKYGEGLARNDNSALKRDIARRIADAVDFAEPAVRRDLRSEVILKNSRHHLDLPHWNVTDKEYASVSAEIADLEAALQNSEKQDPLHPACTAKISRANWCRRVIERYQNPPASIPAEIHVLRLGDTAFASCPFEYYLDFGDRIKGRSPAIQTFVVQLAGNGTYLPTERAASGCSYGAVPASCKVAPAGGQLIVDKAVAVIEDLFAE